MTKQNQTILKPPPVLDLGDRSWMKILYEETLHFTSLIESITGVQESVYPEWYVIGESLE